MWWYKLISVATSIWSCLVPHPQIPPGTNITQCQDLECPKYELTFMNEDYEIRKLAAAHWVGSSVPQPVGVPADGAEAYVKLTEYLSGANDKNQTIPVTLPTIVAMSQGYNETTRNLTLYFYIPAALQADPPVPTDPTVHIQTDPDLNYYVRAFRGVADESVYADNFGLLIGSIDDPSKYVPDTYVTMMWASDWVPWHRRNEVWLLAA